MVPDTSPTILCFMASDGSEVSEFMRWLAAGSGSPFFTDERLRAEFRQVLNQYCQDELECMRTHMSNFIVIMLSL